jgi:hypothetical protein
VLSTTLLGSGLFPGWHGCRRNFPDVGRQRDADRLEDATDVAGHRGAQEELSNLTGFFTALSRMRRSSLRAFAGVDEKRPRPEAFSPSSGHRELQGRIGLPSTDYIWPYVMNYKVREIVTAKGGSIVGEEYYPLDHQDYRLPNALVARVHIE